MRKVTLAMPLVLLGVVALLLLAACAKATPTATPRPAEPTATLAPGVTPTAKPAATVAPTPTLNPTIPAIQFPKGEPAPGVYKTYEEAQKDWPNVIAAAKKEGKLLISTFGAAPVPGSYTYELYNTFAAKYGIQVEYQGGRTAEQLAKAEAEKTTGRHTLDAWPSGPTAVRPVCAAGFCEPFVTPGALEPGVPWIVNPLAEGTHLGTIAGGGAPGGQVYLWQVNPVLINTDREPDKTKWPTSYLDLANPYWKGKIAMEDVRNMGPIADFFDYSTRPAGVALGMGEPFLQALIKNVARLYVGTTPTAEAVVKGDQAIAPMIPPGSSLVNFIKLPKPWNWELLEMKEGQMGWVLSIAQFKGAPHPNATRLLADFLVSKEGDEIKGKYFGAGIGRQDTKALWPGVAPAKIFPVDYGDVNQTMNFTPILVKEKATKWLADAGF